MYYIPSIEKEVTFNFLTVEQYKKIITAHNNYLTAYLGFNLSIIQTIKQNCLEETTLTDFDKHAIFIQMYLKDFEKQGQFNKDIKQPNFHTISSDNYNIKLDVPSFLIEKEYCLFLMQQKTNFSDIFLLTEVAKYIQSIKCDSFDINWITDFTSKIKVVQTLPINILIEIIKYIDNYKAHINSYYEEALGKNARFIPTLLVV